MTAAVRGSLGESRRAAPTTTPPTWRDCIYHRQNPFTYEFFAQEQRFYGLDTEPVREGKAEIRWTVVQGRCDDFLNVNFRVLDIPTPILTLDGRTWMSLTPMELQAQYLAILEAEGEVWTAGLGLGHFALRAAEKPAVPRVVVYETEPDVVALFNRLHGHRPYFSKIEIRLGDFREALRDHPFDADYVYMDVYPTLCGNDALEDVQEFRPSYPAYTFWGYEKVMFDALQQEIVSHYLLSKNLRRFFRLWLTTTVSASSANSQDNSTTLGQLYQGPHCNEEYCEAVMKAML